MRAGRVMWTIRLLVVSLAFQLADAINQEPQAFQQETLTSSPPTKKSSPCVKVKVNDVKMHLKVMRNEVIGGRGYGSQQPLPVPDNCSEDGDGTVSEPVAYDYWKLHIIMASTVTAAVEFVLIIFIILYWRQIRWTLRKITCPCDNRRNSHEAMEQDEEPEEETRDLSSVELHITPCLPRTREQRRSQPNSSSQTGQQGASAEVQTYTSPRWSRVQSATDDLDSDLAVPGPSGLNTQCMTRSPFRTMVHTYSSSDESLDTSLTTLPAPSLAMRTAAPVSPAKGTSKNRTKGSKGKCVGSPERRPPRTEHDIVICGDKVGSDSAADLSDILCKDKSVQNVSLSFENHTSAKKKKSHNSPRQANGGVSTFDSREERQRLHSNSGCGDMSAESAGVSNTQPLLVETIADVHCDSPATSTYNR